MEKMKLRNSAMGLTSILLFMVVALVIFFGSYLYVAENVTSAGLIMDQTYVDAFDNLTKAQDDLVFNVNKIKHSVDVIKESESLIEQAWNGMKGLGNALKLPLNFLSVAIAGWEATVPSLDIVPGWVLPLAILSMVVFFIFLVLRNLKGEPAMG